MNIDTSVLVALGASILAYRVGLSLWSEFGLKTRDIAVLSSEKIAEDINLIAAGAGILSLFDFDRARTLVRQKGEAYVGMLLVALGTAFSLAGLLSRRVNADPLPIVGGVLAGLGVAWAMTKTCFEFLRRFKAPAWLDHGWLEWLEIHVPDPLDPHASVAQTLVVVARASPHPDLEDSLRRRFGDGPMLPEIAEATEQWVAELVAKRNHCFRSAPWREWYRKMRPQRITLNPSSRRGPAS